MHALKFELSENPHSTFALPCIRFNTGLNYFIEVTDVYRVRQLFENTQYRYSICSYVL